MIAKIGRWNMAMREKNPIREEFQNNSFATEEEEADWWDSQLHETLSEEFLRAAVEEGLGQPKVEEAKEPEANG